MEVLEATTEVEGTDKPLEDMSYEELQTLEASMKEGETLEEPTELEADESAEEDESQEEPEQDNVSEVTADKEPEEESSNLKKEMENLQKAFARTQTELGESRKLRELMEKMLAEKQGGSQSEDDDVDPYTDPDKFFEKKMNQYDQKKTVAQTVEQQKLDETKSYVNSHIEKFDDLVPEITEELGQLFKDDPNVSLYKENFSKNPYIVDSLTLMFAGRVAQLKQQLAKVQGKADDSNNGKKELINKINKFGRNKSAVKGGGGNSSSNNGARALLTANQIEATSADELEKIYSQLVS